MSYAIQKLEELAKKFEVSFVISASAEKDSLPESVQQYVSVSL